VRRAFVLIRSDPGAKGENLEALEEIPEVREVPQIHGIYDIIAQVEAETMPELKEVVTQRIRLLDKVRATLIMICLDPGSGGRGWSA